MYILCTTLAICLLPTQVTDRGLEYGQLDFGTIPLVVGVHGGRGEKEGGREGQSRERGRKGGTKIKEVCNRQAGRLPLPDQQ